MVAKLRVASDDVSQTSLSERITPHLGEIASRAVQTEDARVVPVENIDLLRKAGFFRALVPAVKGGDERDLTDFCGGVRSVVKACPSTGWVAGVLNVHPAGVCHFSLSVQDKVWETGPDTIICSSGSPQMKAKRVDGGMLLNGRGRWSSGCNHAEWAVVGAKLPDPSNAQYPEHTFHNYNFLVHRSEYVIEDTWYSRGMRGSGSNDLVFDDVFVPYERMERLEALNFGFSHGAGMLESWIARVPFGLLFGTFLPAVALGCADGMVEQYLKRQRSRKNAYTHAQGILNPAGYMRLAESLNELESLSVFYNHVLDDIQNIGVTHARLGEERFMSLNSKLAFVAERAVQVIDRLFYGAGSSAIADFNPMQRYWRDGHTARLHQGMDYDYHMQQYGRSVIGLPLAPDL